MRTRSGRREFRWSVIRRLARRLDACRSGFGGIRIVRDRRCGWDDRLVDPRRSGRDRSLQRIFRARRAQDQHESADPDHEERSRDGETRVRLVWTGHGSRRSRTPESVGATVALALPWPVRSRGRLGHGLGQHERGFGGKRVGGLPGGAAEILECRNCVTGSVRRRSHSRKGRGTGADARTIHVGLVRDGGRVDAVTCHEIPAHSTQDRPAE